MCQGRHGQHSLEKSCIELWQLTSAQVANHQSTRKAPTSGNLISKAGLVEIVAILELGSKIKVMDKAARDSNNDSKQDLLKQYNRRKEAVEAKEGQPWSLLKTVGARLAGNNRSECSA